MYSLLIPPRYSSQGLFLISQTIRNDGALSFIVCAKKTKIHIHYTLYRTTEWRGGRRAGGERSISPAFAHPPAQPLHAFSRLQALCGFPFRFFPPSLASPRGAFRSIGDMCTVLDVICALQLITICFVRNIHTRHTHTFRARDRHRIASVHCIFTHDSCRKK